MYRDLPKGFAIGTLGYYPAVPKRAGTVSIRDVARVAGVSPTTVSHALNGLGRVNDETSARVMNVARELGYRANPSALHVRHGRSGILAIAISMPPGVPYGVTDLEFLVVALSSAAETALEHRYFPTLLPPLLDLTLLDNMPADGAIVIDPVPGDPVLARMHDHGVATVTVGRDRSTEDPWWVDSDFDRIAAAVLDHLAAGGARRIMLLTASGGQSYMDDQRDAYARWVREHDRPELILEVEPPFDEHDFKRSLHARLEASDPPDAVYVVPERLTTPLLEVLSAAELRVPEDITVAVASESVTARSGRMPLTAVDLDPAAVGRNAVELLLARLDGSQPAGPRIVPARIEVRGSTARGAARGTEPITIER
jgi:DNA-binding LacI/PurR family transcriptional regulator